MKVLLLASVVCCAAASQDVIVRLKATTSEPLRALPVQHANRQGVHTALVAHASQSQEQVLRLLKEHDVEFQSFWIENALAIRAAPASLVAALKAHEDVATVEVERMVRLPRIEKDFDPAPPQNNVAELNVEPLWKAGIRGQGVVVANIDSGVRWTHESLKDNYRGFAKSKETVNHDYASWDAAAKEYTPDTVDIFGHGSHTMGTLAGGGPKGIGMAPEAEWIQAKAFDWEGGSKESDLLAAAQWVMCPTNYDHTGQNCSKGADIVSCSFGGDAATQSWLNPSVSAWRAAGMLGVFASGNVNAMQCASVLCAACSDDAIAVGGLGFGGAYYGQSGKGPSVNGTIKPDFVAPATAINSICSAADSGHDGYMRLTGTSMATPHVAGALALALSAARRQNAEASGEDALKALRATTKQGLKKPFLAASECGGTPWNIFPNNIYGWGEPDACLAANKLGAGLSCSTSTIDV